MSREKKTNAPLMDEGDDNQRNSKRTRISYQHLQEILQKLNEWEDEQKEILCQLETTEISITQLEELQLQRQRQRQRQQPPQTLHNLYMGGSNGIFTIVAVDSAGSYNIFMNAINRSIGGGGGGTDISSSFNTNDVNTTTSNRHATDSTTIENNRNNHSNNNTNDIDDVDL